MYDMDMKFTHIFVEYIAQNKTVIVEVKLGLKWPTKFYLSLFIPSMVCSMTIPY